MRISLTDEEELSSLVGLVMPKLLEHSDYEDTSKLIQERYKISEEDAELALDRIPGGAIRAITGNLQNCPDQSKDPLAFIAFQRVWKELPRKSWFSRSRRPCGRWLAWFEELQALHNNGESGRSRV